MSAIQVADEDIIRYASCGYHCFNRCILKVRIKKGVIVSCEPDDTINPGIAREDAYISKEIINQGMIGARPCAKGYVQARMLYDPKRLLYPMKRIGKRGEANFKRISWDEALDTVAGKLVEVKTKYGPYSVLHQPYTYAGNCSFPLAPWFGVGFAGWAAHSTNGWEEPEQWVLGQELLKKPITMDLIEDEANILRAKFIVLWGLNPVSVYSSGFNYTLLRAREQGIPIIGVESRYSPSMEIFTDQWIPIRPTTDVAMMIAMANVWFKEDLCDKAFIEKWVEPDGLSRWKAYVLGSSDGCDKNPQWAEGICGVPAETIAAFARLYIQSKPVNLQVALSLGRQFYGENATRAAMYLQALSGNTGLPGATAAAESGLWKGHKNVPLPVVNWGRQPGTYIPPVLMAAHKWPKTVNLRERFEKGEISKEEYNNNIGNVSGNEPPNIQMLIIESSNHLNSLPDINATINAMKKVDFTLVVNQYTEAPTARYADILLPHLYTAFEGRNCPTRMGDLFYLGYNLSNYFIYNQKCVDAPGEVKSNTWIWTQVAKRLGIAELYNPRLCNVHDDQFDEAIEALHCEAYQVWTHRPDIAPLNPPDWEEFQKKPVFRWKITDPHYAFKGELGEGKNPFKRTSSGKIEFYSQQLAMGSKYLANNEFYPGTGKCYGPGGLPPMAQMTMGGKDTFYSKDTEKYPLLMSSPHSVFRVHSFLDNQPLLNVDCYRHAIWLNIADARARGIKDNDRVRVYNDIGEAIVPAYVTSRIVPGTAALFHGGWYTPGQEKSQLNPDGIDTRGAVNLFTHDSDLPDTVIGNFAAKGLVQVEKLEEQQ